MVVYWEYAYLENCLLDGLLLYLALKCARGRVRFITLILAAGIGGAEAVLFPLAAFPIWASYLVKLAGGALIAVIAVSKGTKKTYLIVVSAFFLMTFALGGLLTAAYSFFDVEYEAGNGFLVERAPVGLVIATAGIFACLVRWGVGVLYRYKKIHSGIFPCALETGDKRITVKGFADSGNCLTFRGEPVSVISAVLALALFRKEKEVGRMTVGTVNGVKEQPVFRCKGMEIGCGSKAVRLENCLFTVGEIDAKDYKIILHTALLEGCYENSRRLTGITAKNTGK